MRARRLPALLCLLVLAGCGADEPAAPAGPARGTAHGVEWVVMPAAVHHWFDSEGDAHWTPSAAQAEAAMKGIPALLERGSKQDPRAVAVKARLASYKCQIVGVVSEGRKLVHCNFIHESFSEPDIEEGDEPWDWREHPIIVDDGGDFFWQVRFDAEKGTYASVSINGEA
jgi:hypothetical protein